MSMVLGTGPKSYHCTVSAVQAWLKKEIIGMIAHGLMSP